MAGLAQFLVGHVLDDRYRLESVLGEGGFGVVLRAADLRGEREVAVKVLDAPRGMTGVQVQRLRQRFQREAEVAARLPVHPNLVPVLDYGATERLDYLVMELLRGESLRERLARQDDPVPLRTALRILRDAALGVAAGHETGLVHRDLKPANIFLEGDAVRPRVRILDFGIAKLLDEAEDEETRTHLTLPGEWFGSEFYSPPEHLRREAVTRASDVYSLGVVAFELLTRTRLFTSQDQDRRRRGLPVPVPSLVARNAAIPRDVERIVLKALADDPAERFEDAGEMAAELHRAIGRLRRATDLAADATVAAPVAARTGDDATQVVDAGASAVTMEVPRSVFGFRRRGKDAAPDLTGLDREMERLRWKKVRRRALQAAGIGVLAFGGVAGGYGIAAMREAQGTVPSAAAPTRILTAVEENEEGIRRFRDRDYAGALEHFGRAMQQAPGNAEYMNNHAYALLRAGRTDQALAALQEVVAQHPEREVAYSNLAEAQLAKGDTAGVITTMQALLAIGPSDARRHEAETLLARLGADAWDTAEWEDTQPVDEAPVEDAGQPWDGWTPPEVGAGVDTVIAENGMRITERARIGGAGIVRRRVRDRDGRWRDTVMLHTSPRDTLRIGLP
ncbi:MAG TPA: protein kinase [Longimicrobium sp.]|jgi:tetratricopeptide (TPR) repeat protein|uniref:protein kinase domain-containing protein n=1 Tax=Longimicrobium sp. TaxID=2029185 RepID=UPI002ED92568